MLNGTGVSNEAQRITGASKIEKQFSAIHAAISPPIPPVIVSSCDPVKGGCFRNFDNIFKTIPVRPGYYYIHLVGNPNRQILIRISEGEVVDYRQNLLLY